MHAAQGAAFGTQRIVELHKVVDKASRAEFFFAEGSGKKAAVIAAFLELDEVSGVELSLEELHAALRAAWSAQRMFASVSPAAI
jgi:hypothetical protein